MSKQLVAGIDIGGTNSVFGLVDRKGNCIAKGSIPTAQLKTAESLVKEISRAIKGFSEGYEVLGAGIGAPSANYHNGSIEHAANLQWKGIVPLARMFQRMMKIPVVLTNDANAGALGEMIFGGAKNMKDFIFITLGTGLGSGIVVDGRVVYGHDGFAGEIGHTCAIPGGRACGCGRKGCLETYVSATGIKRTINEWIEAGKTTSLAKFPAKDISAERIYNEALNGDQVAREAFEFTGEILGRVLADSVAYTSPEAIFLFGGLANAGDLIFKPTIEHFEANLLRLYQGKVKILQSGLFENNAAILGAAALIWDELEKRKQHN
jgi:glucokinase